MKLPFFSIIIPTKNPNKVFFKQCLDSVYFQTDKDYELVVVANNCDNDCFHFIKNELRKFSNENLINTSEQGVSVARNIGLRESSGKYIIFLDDDDMISPFLLESIKKILNIYYFDLLAFRYSLDSNSLSHTVSSDAVIFSKEQVDSLFFDLKNNYGIETRSVWGKVFASKIIKSNNILFCETLHNGEDTCFVLDYISHCTNVLYLKNLIGYFYRTNANSVTYKYNPDIINQFDIYYDEYKRILLINNKSLYYLHYILINQIIYNIFISYIFNKENNVGLMQKTKELKSLFKKNQYEVALSNIKVKDLHGIKKKVVTFLIKLKLYFIPAFLLNKRYCR